MDTLHPFTLALLGWLAYVVASMFGVLGLILVRHWVKLPAVFAFVSTSLWLGATMIVYPTLHPGESLIERMVGAGLVGIPFFASSILTAGLIGLLIWQIRRTT